MESLCSVYVLQTLSEVVGPTVSVNLGFISCVILFSFLQVKKNLLKNIVTQGVYFLIVLFIGCTRSCWLPSIVQPSGRAPIIPLIMSKPLPPGLIQIGDLITEG